MRKIISKKKNWMFSASNNYCIAEKPIASANPLVVTGRIFIVMLIFLAVAFQNANAQSTLCASSPTTFGYEYVSSVSINGVTKPGDTGYNGPGYIDYSASSLTTLTAGSTYPVSVTVTNNGSYQEYVKMWFDFNGDGNLTDAGDLVLDQNFTFQGVQVYSGNVTVPTTAYNGAVYVRVILTFLGSPALCGPYNYGNTLDFKATITGGVTPQKLTIATDGTGGATGSVTSAPAAINTAAGTNSANFANGSTVTLTATPSSSEFFTGWTGDVTSSGNPLTVTMNSAENITANFSKTTPPVAPAAPASGGNVTITYSGAAGNSVSATAPSGSTVDWYDAATGGNKLATGVNSSATTVYNSPAIAAGTYKYYAESRNTTTGTVSSTRTLVTVTINPSPITVTANAANKTYGQTDPAFTYSITSGTLFGSDAFTGALTRTAGENVGAYPITQGTLALSANYALSYTGNNLTIGQKAIMVTANAQAKTYGAADPAFTYSITSGTLVGTDAFTGSLSRTAGENVGTYAIIQGTLTPGTNYALTYTGANLTIGTQAVTVTANAKTKTYGVADPALTYSITSGALVGSDAFTGALNRTAGENVGAYPITQGSLALNANYTLTYAGNNLTIGQEVIMVTANAQAKTYGATDPALTYSITSGTLVGSDAFTGALTRTAGENVGAYPITQGTLALSANYALSYAGANLTIGQEAITVTANAQTKAYGITDPVLTYSITNGVLVGGDAFTGSLTRAAGENVGIYAITHGTLALSANYALTYAGANLTIGQEAITVTANAEIKNYGQTDPALTYSITSGALVGSDTFTGSLTRAAGENVGTYAITQGTLALGANYALSYAGANLTIDQKAIMVTANAQAKTYGQTDPALTYSITSGALVGSDAFTGSLTRAAGENAGTYAITQGTLALSTNYAVTYAGSNLAIGATQLTITPDNQGMGYGAAVPALTASYSGFVNGDTPASLTTLPALSTTGQSSSPAGTYAITASGAVGANYTITYTAGTLTVSPVALTVTPDNQGIIYGTTPPALTAGYSGFVNGDTQASLTTQPAITTIANSASPVGTYAITASGAADANYIISFVPGALSITPATRTLTFNQLASKNYGDADFGPAAVASTGETVSYSSNDTTIATIINGKVHITGVGATTITASVAANSNYTSAPTVTQQLVVNKGQQTVNLVTIPTLLKGGQFDLGAITTSSGLPLTFTISDPTIATIQGQTITGVNLGTATLTISQPGNADYLPMDPATVTINVDDHAGDEILVHQAVSPNNDGINDFLYIEGIKNYPANVVTLFNRDGVMIFRVPNYDNDTNVFNGRSNITGALQQEGTYYYKVEFTANGESKHKTGFIVLKYK